MNEHNQRTQGAGSVTIPQPAASRQEASAHPINPAEARAAVIREVASWQGVSVEEHRFGGVAFRVDRRELGHVHGVIADLPFPRRVRDELVAAGHARPHHVLPESGWVTVPMGTVAEVAGVIALFRLNYDRAARTRS